MMLEFMSHVLFVLMLSAALLVVSAQEGDAGHSMNPWGGAEGEGDSRFAIDL